jgi:putative glutamine amidotransferase
MKQSDSSPIVAITTAAIAELDGNGHRKSISRVNNRYLALATDFGATPVLLFAESDPRAAKALLSRVQGLIIIGGQDLDPATYGQECAVRYDASIKGAGTPYHRPIDLAPNRRRDDFEIALYGAAIEIGVPVLGICRGMQLINVAEGGSLLQEMPPEVIDHCAGDDGFIHHHPIQIAEGSFTHHTLKTQHYFTSSIHHQAVDRLGAKLKKTAWAPDDVIEVVERIDDKNFVVGVLGHIEQTRRNLPLYDKLLAGFIDRCSQA